MLSQTRPRSVRRIRANRSRWPTQYMPARTKLITKAISDGRSPRSAWFSEWPLVSSGTWTSSTSRGMMIANTPSDRARTRAGSGRRSASSLPRPTSSPARPAAPSGSSATATSSQDRLRARGRRSGTPVGGAGVDRLGHAGGRAVAPAVVGGAQMRAALHHLAGDGRPVAGRGAAAVVGVAVGLVPVAGPLPDVADHVEQAVAVGREPAHRGRPCIAVQLQVLDRELALPGVGHPAAVRVELVAPGELRPLQPTAAGQLPLGLGGQVLAGPGGVGGHVGPGDVDHWVVGFLLDRAGRPLGVAPVGPRHIGPPVVVVTQVDPVAWGAEHHRGRDQRLRSGAGVVGRVGDPLGHRHMPGCPGEAGELGVGDGVPVDPEPVHADLVGRRLLWVVVVRSHQVAAAGDPAHARPRPREGHGAFYRPAVSAFSSLSTTWSMVKLAARWRGGNSLKVARNWVITAVAARAM